ncbi:hypothetical protein OFN97_03925 [Campylobacter sp. VBCF_05 NA6]|uniref:hypothetical protein n=1 Tax=unclassified Campylobacter TaxID=2593542 RepID=UPI0022E9A401|nr:MULTISPECIES: hypothetical protein [unclassified Campylobacter]MDA3047940.1 hypothetical protein [Campylobacter sp. JMF_08 NE1]MDA3049886.1 hypothetical protein [Campylobacter sp. JMF_15 NE4]MDA3050844.1 hypothetical protein [Campylobacter sp. JMF_02 ED1]MDA3057261.1 hypothetical protein [Campylobacter sp. VBCF_04 NA7]MDA3059167.1 hypothetical protein [Campylobacter sp. VBCF_05 NA6]
MKKFLILCFVFIVMQASQIGDAKNDFVSAINHFYKYFLENGQFDEMAQNMTKIVLPIKVDGVVCVDFDVKNKSELEIKMNKTDEKCRDFARNSGKVIDIKGAQTKGKIITR